MTFKLIQAAAVLSLTALTIACTLAHCWTAAFSLSGLAMYIGMQDAHDPCDGEDEQ